MAPTSETFAIQDREEFEQSYTRQLEALDAQTILGQIRTVAGEQPAILLCWEKPHEPFCHRWTLAHWIEEQTGIVIPELEPGHLPRRPDAPQLSLFDGEERG